MDTLIRLPQEKIDQLSDEDKATYYSMIGRDDLIVGDIPSAENKKLIVNIPLTEKVHEPIVKGRINVNSNLSVKELVEKYDIPKATAWRAKKRGYFVASYHEKSQPMNPDADWFTSNQGTIDSCIEIGVQSAINQYPIGDRELSIEDLKAEAMLRLFELSGVVEKRENKGWLVNVAKNAARNLIKKSRPVSVLSEYS